MHWTLSRTSHNSLVAGSNPAGPTFDATLTVHLTINQYGFPR